MALMELIVTIAAFVIAAIPLHFAVSLLGGNSSILKVILVNVLVGFLTNMIYDRFETFAIVILFLVVLLVYKIMFELGWLRAFFAWLLQGAIVVVLLFLAKVILNVSTLI